MAHLNAYILGLCVLCLVIMIVVTIFHIYKERNTNKKTRKKLRTHHSQPSLRGKTSERWSTLLVISNYFAIFGYIFHVFFILILEIWTLNNHTMTDANCRLKWNLMAFGVHFTKFSMYLLFITRIYCCFMTSHYGYSLSLFIGLYIYLFVYLAIATFNDFYFIDSIWDHTDHFCKPLIPFVSMISTLIVDVSISILSIVLFARPLYKIMRATNYPSPAFVNLAIKKCILVFIALLSTMIVVLILFTTSIVLLQIDDLINLFCIMFMFNIHHKLYQNTCGRICHKRIAFLLGSSPKWAHQLMMNLELSKTSTAGKTATKDSSRMHPATHSPQITMSELQMPSKADNDQIPTPISGDNLSPHIISVNESKSDLAPTHLYPQESV